ncbi:hypothetical protein K523DRAFT_235470 [Schizophyllum commune Tattone D]|nr:hypothetical protein K523DRAFT_235470 [Schizophyllum commune Tattone D]
MSTTMNGGDETESLSTGGAGAAPPDGPKLDHQTSTSPTSKDELIRALADTQALLEVMTRRNGDLASRIEGLSSAQETQALLKHALEGANHTLRSELSMAQQETRRLQGELDTLSSVRDTLQAEISTVKVFACKLLSHKSLTYHQNEVNSRMAAEESKVARVTKDLEMKCQELQHLRSRLQVLEDENRSLQEGSGGIARAEQAEVEARVDYDQLVSRAEAAEERVEVLEENNERLYTQLQAAEYNVAAELSKKEELQTDLKRIAGYVTRLLGRHNLLDVPPISTDEIDPQLGSRPATTTWLGPPCAADGSPEPDNTETASHPDVDDVESASHPDSASPTVSGGKRSRNRSASSGSDPSEYAPKRSRRAPRTVHSTRSATTSAGSSRGPSVRIAKRKKQVDRSSAATGGQSEIVSRNEQGHCFDKDGKRVCPECKQTQERYSRPRWLRGAFGTASVCQK